MRRLVFLYAVFWARQMENARLALIRASEKALESKFMNRAQFLALVKAGLDELDEAIGDGGDAESKYFRKKNKID